MTRESLLQMLEELAGRVRSLERDNKQVALTIQGFEREVGKLGAVIASASEKVSGDVEGWCDCRFIAATGSERTRRIKGP